MKMSRIKAYLTKLTLNSDIYTNTIIDTQTKNIYQVCKNDKYLYVVFYRNDNVVFDIVPRYPRKPCDNVFSFICYDFKAEKDIYNLLAENFKGGYYVN